MGNMDAVIQNFVNGALIVSVIALIIFLVLREVICWYWKINRSIALLTEIRDLLTAKSSSQTAGVVAVQQSPTPGVGSPTNPGGA